MEGNEIIREASGRAAAAFGGAVGDKIGDKLADLLERLAGDAVDALGERLGTAIRAPESNAGGLDSTIARWRARNVVAVLARASEIFDERGIEARQVPAPFLVPLLDEAARVADDELRERWATLLVNGTQNAAAQHPQLIRTLAQLSAEDSRLLHRIEPESAREAVENGQQRPIATPCVKIESQEEHDALDRLAAAHVIKGPMAGGGWMALDDGRTLFIVTPLGDRFLDAVFGARDRA